MATLHPSESGSDLGQVAACDCLPRGWGAVRTCGTVASELPKSRIRNVWGCASHVPRGGVRAAKHSVGRRTVGELSLLGVPA